MGPALKKCHLFYTHLCWGCRYKWNAVVSALCRFCPGRFGPGSFLPNLVGRFCLFFSKSQWVRYDRLKKNVIPYPYPTLPYWVVFQCWTKLHFHYPNPYSSPPPPPPLPQHPAPILPLSLSQLKLGRNNSGPKWPRAETTRLLRPKRPTPKIGRNDPGRNDPGPKRPGFVQMTGTFKVTGTLQALVYCFD